MSRIVSGLLALSLLSGCGAAITPVADQARAVAAVAARSSGGLVNGQHEPFKPPVEADFRAIDDVQADRLLARHPRTLTELAEQKVKIDGELDWDRRWYRTGPRAIYLHRNGKRHELMKTFSYGLWEKAIGKRVTVYVQPLEVKHPKEDIVLFFPGARYYD